MTEEAWDGAAALAAAKKKQSAMSDATQWKPEAGEELTGTLIGVSYQMGNFGPQYVLHVVTKDGDDETTWIVYAGSQILMKALVAAAPGIGSGISIAYEGKVPSKKGGNAYHLHVVVAQRRDDELWEGLRLSRPAATERLAVEPDGMGDPF